MAEIGGECVTLHLAFPLQPATKTCEQLTANMREFTPGRLSSARSSGDVSGRRSASLLVFA